MDNPNRTQNVGDDPEQPQQNPQTPGQRQGGNPPQAEPDKEWNPSGGAQPPDEPDFERGGSGQQGGSQGQGSQKPASPGGSQDWEEKE